MRRRGLAWIIGSRGRRRSLSAAGLLLALALASGAAAHASANSTARAQAAPLTAALQQPLADRSERPLLGLSLLLALAVVVLVALLLHQRRRGRRRLSASLRRDPHTALYSRYALEADLDEGLTPQPDAAQSQQLLALVDLRLMERQRMAVLAELDGHALLAMAATAIEEDLQHRYDLRTYRAADHRLALILQAKAGVENGGGDDLPPWEELLPELLALTSAAIQHSANIVLKWDDVFVTGVLFRPDQASSSLLSMHACGDCQKDDEQRPWCLVEPGDERLAREDAEIRSQLLALTADDLELRFQPILQLASPGRFGLELLMRFRSPLLGSLGTGAVFERAYDMGIAHRIDDLLVEQLPEVQRQLMASPLLSSRIDYVSFNVSSESVSSVRRLDHLIARLAALEIDPSFYSIEITEAAATASLSGAAHVVTASERLVRELNFKVLIDDFGTGLSNYRRISEVWYDAIKLDIALVRGIGQSFRLQRYVGSFIGAVHSLGKTIVAEGVESYGDLAVAVRQGADALQGFLISRPVVLQQLEGFLSSSPWASPEWLRQQLQNIHTSDRLLGPALEGTPDPGAKVPLERYILDNWSGLRSFEEFVLLFVNELRSWQLDVMRLSLAFLPDQDDIDCSQYIWYKHTPGEVKCLRMERDFLEMEEHLSSPLHFLVEKDRFLRRRLVSIRQPDFPFLATLKEQGCNDYLGLRLESRGVSTPVLTIALVGGSTFSDEQIQRIEAMSSLLSLLFYAFESERAKRLALLDALTELPNRRCFDSFLRSRIASARLSGESLALALIDLDRFKLVNDTMGHAYGDACLRNVAALLQAALERSTDFVARLGGEEFAMILPRTDAAMALRLGEAVRARVADAVVASGRDQADQRLTVSIGIAVWDPASLGECDSDRFQQLADDCLYEAKRNGRDRVTCRLLTPELSV